MCAVRPIAALHLHQEPGSWASKIEYELTPWHSFQLLDKMLLYPSRPQLEPKERLKV